MRAVLLIHLLMGLKTGILTTTIPAVLQAIGVKNVFEAYFVKDVTPR